MAAWPSTLPHAQAAGYELKPMDPSIRTDMEKGAARVRRNTSARCDHIKATWLMRGNQMAIFRAWFDGDGAGGTAWFTTRLDTGTGGVLPVTARFVGVYSATRMAPQKWTVSAELEIRNA